MAGPPVLFALLLVLYLCGSSLAQHLMVAPNILQMDSKVNVYLEGTAEDLVTLTVKDFPHNVKELYRGQVKIDGKKQALHQIEIKRADIKDLKDLRYVYLKAAFSGYEQQTVVMLSFQGGYVYLQTDKPIYNPEEDVMYRVFVTNTMAKSMGGTLAIDVRNPDKLLVSQSIGDKVEDHGLYSSANYRLPKFVKEGTWTLEARLSSEPNKVYKTSFDVKKHVLPTFEVKLTPSKRFFHVDDKTLTVEVDAMYFFGQEVDGSVYVTFGYVDKQGIRFQFPLSLQRLKLTGGKANAILSEANIIAKVNETKNILGCSLFVRATVFTSTGSDVVEAERTDIKVVESPYTIQFIKSSKYFKPAMTFSLYVYLSDFTGSPAAGITVKGAGQSATTNSHGMAILNINTQKTEHIKEMEVETAADGVPNSYQTKKKITLLAQETKMVKEYLHLAVDQAVVSKDSKVMVTLTFRRDQGGSNSHSGSISYLVVSKGHIILADKWEVTGESQILKHSLLVRPDMLPSFRLVAFYTVAVPGGHEVIADSLWVDVEDECMGQLEVSIDRQRKEYTPHSDFTLQVKGDQGASVGLVVVDKAAYMLSQNGKLTQSKIWDEVEKSDTGCTRGGGLNNLAIFSDAGLLYKSSTERTADRQQLECETETPRRRRRSQSLLEAKSALERKYGDAMQRRCCHDGMMDFPLDYSCEKRSLYITENEQCVQAFLRCCKNIQEVKKRSSSADLILARTNEITFPENEEDIYIRSNFQVSWMWSTIELDGKVNNEGVVTYEKKDVLQDSITNWMVLAVSTSQSKGVCVAKPLEITVRQYFYVDLRLPYAVVNREQVQIKAVLHNYSDGKFLVMVDLRTAKELCSAASAKGYYQRKVMMDAKTQKVVYFTIIPTKPGRHEITVKAFNFQAGVSDAVQKTLLVVPEGVEKWKEETPVILNPSQLRVDKQNVPMIPKLEDQVPGTEADTFITVLGDSLTDTVKNSIGGSVLSSLIKMPGGCVEQTLFSLGAPIIAMDYLDKTNNWKEVGVGRRDEALSYVKAGYESHLGNRRPDDTYSVYSDKPSTWVTAYTVKVFAMVYHLLDVEDARVCNPIAFLITKQHRDGYFEDSAPVTSTRLWGGLSNASWMPHTAFVLIAMQKAHEICATTQGLDGAMNNAADYINREMPKESSPYAMAISAYALAVSERDTTETFKHLLRAKTDNAHWGGTDELGMEATGYALLALLELKKFELAEPVSQWLMGRVGQTGQWSSTQTTGVVFEALARYQTLNPPPPDSDLKISIAVNSPARTEPIAWKITQGSRITARSEKVPQLNDFNLVAEGKGSGILKVYTVYQAMIRKELSVCTGFEMTVTMNDLMLDEAMKQREAISAHNLTICVRPLQGTDDKSTILDVSLPSGFAPDLEHLQKMVKRKDHLINYFEMDKALSAKGSLIIHVYETSHEQPHCVPVILYKEFPVGFIQPAPVRAYTYYQSEMSCTQFYGGGSTDLDTICNKAECACVSKNACPSLKTDVDPPDRETKACDGNYPVYKITVAEIIPDVTLDNYVMEIKKVYKDGNDIFGNGDYKRHFFAHRSCRDTLNLSVGQELMIINRPSEMLKNANRGYDYVLTESTWLETFETAGDTAEDQQEFLNKMETSGCGT